MQQAKLLDKIKMLIEPTITALGYELWGCVLHSAKKKLSLCVYVDVPLPPAAGFGKNHGVTLDALDKISREISALLDVEDLIRGAYNLEVSSPGLERQLFTKEHYLRFVGSNIITRLSISQDGKKNYTGRLIAVENEAIKLEVNKDEVVTLPLAIIEKTNVVF